MPIRSAVMPNSLARARTSRIALRVAELDRMVGTAEPRHFENEDGDAGGVEIVRHLPAFVIGRKGAISSARRNDNGRTRWLTGAEQRHRRPVRIVGSERPRWAPSGQQKGFRLGVQIRLGCICRWGGRLRDRHSIARGSNHGHRRDQTRDPQPDLMSSPSVASLRGFRLRPEVRRSPALSDTAPAE